MIYHIHHIHQISFWLCLTSVTGAGAPALVPLWPQHPPRASRGAFLQDSWPQGPTLGQVEAECQVCFEAPLSELRKGAFRVRGAPSALHLRLFRRQRLLRGVPQALFHHGRPRRTLRHAHRWSLRPSTLSETDGNATETGRERPKRGATRGVASVRTAFRASAYRDPLPPVPLAGAHRDLGLLRG